MHTAGYDSERLVGHDNLDKGLRLAIWNCLRVHKEELKEATVVGVFVRVEVTVITEKLGNLFHT